VFSVNLQQYKNEVNKDINGILAEYEKQVKISKKKIKEIEASKKTIAATQDQATNENQKALRKVIGKDTKSEAIDLVKKNMEKIQKIEVGDDG
jgi:hypothetical protein